MKHMLKRIASILLTVVMVISSWNPVFAARGKGDSDDEIQNDSRTYSHFDLNFDEVNGVKVKELISVTAVTPVTDRWGRTTYKTEELDLERQRNSKEGDAVFMCERRNYEFTSDTEFTVVLVLRKADKKEQTITAVFKDTDPVPEKYANKYTSYYEYTRKVLCADEKGIDVEISVADLIGNNLSVSYADENGNTYVDIVDGTSYKNGATVTITDEVPTKEGYTFVGWSYEGKTYTSGQTITMGSANIVLTAVWAKTYTVTHIVNGLQYGPVQVVTEGENASLFEYVTTDDSIKFNGWNKTAEDLENVRADIEVIGSTATKTFTITYKVDGEVVKTEQVSYGDSYIVDFDYNAGDAYNFDGWYIGAKKVTSVENVKTDYEITGTTSDKTYTVIFEVEGEEVHKETVKYGQSVSLYNYAPAEGYDFNGWDRTADELTNITENMVVSGTVSKKTFNIYYVVTDNTVGIEEADEVSCNTATGTVVYTATVEYGDSYAVDYVLALNEGEVFDGWYINGNKVTSIDAVKESYIITGTKSLKEFTVTYTINGEYYSSESVKYGMKATLPEYTPAEGYDFGGWDIPEDINLKSITSDVVINAYVTIQRFTVTFCDYDGSIIKQETYNYGATNATAPKNPTRDADYSTGDKETEAAGSLVEYTFSSWKAAGDYDVKDIVSVTCDMTFTAQYKAKAVTVTFYILNKGLEQPSELASYSSSNYSKGVAGTIYEYIKIANDDAAVAANICKAPTAEDFGLELEEDQEIKWYVIKRESDGFHVDGIITNQKYELTINYVDTNGDAIKIYNEAGETIGTYPAYTEKVSATGSYMVESPTALDYKLIIPEQAEVAGVMPYGNVTIDVVYDYVQPTFYTVSFVLDGKPYGTVQTVRAGKDAVLFGEPEVATGFKFDGWDKTAEDLVNVTENIVVNGYTSKVKFTITYKVDNETIGTDSAEYGDDYVVGYDYDGYDSVRQEFNRWFDADGNVITLIEDIKANHTVYGNVTDKAFTVTYYINGEEYKQEVVTYGGKSIPDEYIAEEGYEFSGWSWSENYDLTNVTTDIEVFGTVSKKEFTITFVDADGTVIDEDTYEYGSIAVAPENPTKEDETEGEKIFTFVFDKWVAQSEDYTISNILNVTQNMTFTATYIKSEVEQKFTLTINYVDKDSEEAVFVQYVEEVVAGAAYFVETPVSEDYILVDESEAVVMGVMPYNDVTIVVEFDKVEEETTTEETTTEETTTEEETTVEETTEEETTEEETTEEETTVEETTEEETTEEETTEEETTVEETTEEETTEEETTEEETTVEETTEETTTEEETTEEETTVEETTEEETTEEETTVEETTTEEEESFDDEDPYDPSIPEETTEEESTEEETTVEETTEEEESFEDENPHDPQTGDTADKAIYAGLVFMALISMALAVILKSREEDNEAV